ncbi:hypothetical protein ACFQ9Z_38705 [Streptomyces sp. NPDC056580]|uniref:hypothetical protein n=1 Tax=Streptomyces sp. NPDC056580 TaxID=3345872 RepID=UPI003673A98A
MRHETTINKLAQFAGLFSTVDHITVPETNPDTDITEEVTLPPPLIRRTQRRDDTTWWILTPPGIHERIFVADHAPVTVYLKDAGPHRFTGHLPPQQAATPQQAPAPAAWPHQPATAAPGAPAAYPPQQPTHAPQATPQRPAAPWSTQQPHS